MTENVFQFEGEDIPQEKLPIPVGWRILVGMLKIETQTAGGIILTDEHRKGREYLRNVAKVLAVGSECYKHPKFQGGVPIEKATPQPWVKPGDVVMIGQYAGQLVHCEDADGEPQALKLLNDDEILSVIPDLNTLSL